jgi:hypothetical protein
MKAITLAKDDLLRLRRENMGREAMRHCDA